MDEYEARRNTTFEADTPVGRVEVRIGETDGRLRRLLEFYSAERWAFLTAWNAGERFGNEEDNRRRQRELEESLHEEGYRVFSGESVPDHAGWAPEEGALVVEISRDEALEIGRRHGQGTVVWGRMGEPAQLLDCETGEAIAIGEGEEEADENGDPNETLDDVLSELGGTVQQSVREYRSEPPDSLESAVDWEIVLRSLDDGFPDPDLD